MFHVGSIIFVTTLCALSAYPQESDSKNAASPCSISEIRRSEGWTVPGLAGSTVETRRAAVSNIQGVFVTMLKPPNVESNLTEAQCSDKDPGNIEIIEDSLIKIYALWKFDFGGRVFAYRVEYAPETLFRGKRDELATMRTVFFFDPDGSGKFSVLKYQKWVREPKFTWYLPESVPNWAKRGAGDSPAKP